MFSLLLSLLLCSSIFTASKKVEEAKPAEEFAEPLRALVGASACVGLGYVGFWFRV